MNVMFSKRIRQTHHFNLYTLLWIFACIIVIYLARNWYHDRKLVGIVESKSHLLSAGESGRLQSLLITIGAQVKKDQVLAFLDISDLKTNLDYMRNELTHIQKYEDAQYARSSINVQRMALQLENEASNLIERLSLLESKSTELAGLNAEIERLKNAATAGLGNSRDLSDLILQRDALSTYLGQQSQDLEFQRQQLEKSRESRKIMSEANIEGMSKSMFIEQMEYAEELRRLIVETEHRIRLRTIVAPCDGHVTEILVRQGEVIDAFVPIFKIDEIKPTYLDLYIPEKSSINPEAGMKVEIYSSRAREYNTTGIVSFVHPGVAMASERIAFQGQPFWVRKVRVELAREHHLMPGEIVDARICRREKNSFYLDSIAKASENDMKKQQRHPTIIGMEIQKELLEKTRFEPSGVGWSPKLGRYLIVSDDTGIQNSQSDHAAFLFSMDEEGRVDSAPVPLNGIDVVNDLESLTATGDEGFYLVSSQNISKKSKRPGSRELIIKIQWDGNKYTVQGQVRFLSLLMNSYSRQELGALGLEDFEADGRPVLNIEGASFHDNALYLGLKEPVSPKGAIIWKLENADDIFNTRRLAPNQLSIFGYVQLGQYKNKKTGISDITFDPRGVLWVSSTVVDAEEGDQMGGFYRIDRFADGRLDATQMDSFPNLKPEGICPHGDDRFLIVFDEDEKTAVFCYVETTD